MSLASLSLTVHSNQNTYQVFVPYLVHSKVQFMKENRR